MVQFLVGRDGEGEVDECVGDAESAEVLGVQPARSGSVERSGSGVATGAGVGSAGSVWSSGAGVSWRPARCRTLWPTTPRSTNSISPVIRLMATVSSS
ncbi:hypothetical protein NKH18_06845 [Streptomyces sp. M10(2022)]